jgi:hypothetical protein
MRKIENNANVDTKKSSEKQGNKKLNPCKTLVSAKLFQWNQISLQYQVVR